MTAFTRTVAVVACTLVASATFLLGAVGPAIAVQHTAPIAGDIVAGRIA